MAKNPIDIEKEMNAVLEHQKKLRSELLDINSKIEKIKKSDTKSENILNTLIEEKNKKLEKQQKISDFLTKQREKEKTFQEDTESYNDDLEKHWDLAKEITQNQNKSLEEKNKKQDRYLKGVGDIVQFKSTENTIAKIGVKFLEEGTDESLKALSIANDSLTTRRELSGVFDEISKQAKNVGKAEFQTLDLSQTKLDIQKKIANVESNKNDIGEKRSKILIADLKQQEKFITGLDKSQKILQKENEILNKSKESFSGMTDKAFGFVESLPGGDLLSKAFNFDGLKDSANDMFGNAIQGNFKEALGSAKEMGGGLMSSFKVGEMGAMSMGAKIALATGGITLIIGGLMKVGKWLLGINQGQADMAKEMGTTVENAIELNDAFGDIAYNSGDIGISTEKIKNTALELKNEMGGVVTTNTEFLTQMAQVKESFGLSTAEANKLDMAATMMGSNMEDFTNEVTAATMEMEKQLGTTIDSRQVMKDLAEIPPGLQASFKGSTAELVMANQKAKMLGMTLKDVEGIGESLLNIEGSLQTEMEARVLTGKNINLDLARQYALTGETGKLQEELLNQAGSLSEFQELNPMAQKKFAEAMGMSKDQMAEMLTKAEQQKKLGFDLNALTAEEIDKKMESNKITDEGLLAAVKKRKEELRAKSLQETMMDIFTKIKDVVARLVEGPLGGVVNKIQQFLGDQEKIEGVIETVKGIFSAIVPIVSTIFDVGVGLVKTLGKGVSFVSNLFGGFTKVEDGTKAVKANIVGIGAGILAAITAVGLLKKGFGLAKSAASKLGDTIKDKVTSKIKEKGGGLFSKLGGGDNAKSISQKAPKGGGESGGMVSKLAKGLEKMDPKKLIAGAAALVLVAGALWITSKAMIEFTKVTWKAVAMGITSLIALVGAVALIGAIMTSGVGAVAILAGAAAMVVLAGALWILGKAMQEMGKAAEDFIPLIEVVFSGLATTIEAIAGGVVDVIKTIGDQIERIGNIDGKNLLAVGAGLTVVGAGLAAMGAGKVMDSLGGLAGMLTGQESPITQIERLADLDSESLLSIAKSIEVIANSLSLLGNIDMSGLEDVIDEMGDMDVAQIKAIVTPQVDDGGAIDVDTKTNTKVSLSGNTMLSSDENGGQLGKVIEYLQKIANVSSQPVNIQIGDKTIEAMQTNMTMAKNRRIGLDKTYGST
jgi:hypothetical protein